MRSRTMTAALATGATLVALLSAASGTGLAAGPTGCHIKLEAPAPRLVQAGETTLLFGQLKCVPSANAAGQTMTYYEKVAGTGTATAIGTSVTDSLGKFQFPTPALEKNSQFYATGAGATSSHRAAKVSPKVTIAGPPDGSVIYTGVGPILHPKGLSVFPSRVTFSGQVSPTLEGDQIVLQRENAISGEEWHRIGLGTVGPKGAYAISHVFAIPGAANIRVLVRRTRQNAPGVTESLSYEITQAQNPNLTIFSSKNPLFYGEPVTIEGADKAGAGVKLTLFARSYPSKKFTEVATTTTTTGGAYNFAPQTPLQNTTYKVAAAGKGPGKNSAALFEGVKYLLTVVSPAAAALQGAPIVFSGTVTPIEAGHAVYLQVQNPGGIGFHTVEVGAVGPTGAYSISYVPFVKGARTYRVRVPGDPSHEGAGSKLFAVTTTETTAVLNPEPGNNSTPPNEGH